MKKKRAQIRKEQISDFYQVDEDGLVTQKDSSIIPVLDMSDYTRPFEDEDAINWSLPYNQANATREIYDRLDTQQAKENAAAVKRSIRMLANPVADVADYLRLKHRELYISLTAYDRWETIIDTSRSRLSRQIADRIFCPTPFDEGPSYRGWAEFLGANLDMIDAYRQVYNEWLLMRWLQRMIYHNEKQSLYSILSPVQTKPAPYKEAESVELPLSLRQIALLHIFQNQLMTKNNADQKAQEYGHRSGEKLMKFYDEFKHAANRIQLDGQRVRPMIKDLTAILDLLTGEQRAVAEDEINTLRGKI